MEHILINQQEDGSYELRINGRYYGQFATLQGAVDRLSSETVRLINGQPVMP